MLFNLYLDFCNREKLIKIFYNNKKLLGLVLASFVLSSCGAGSGTFTPSSNGTPTPPSGPTPIAYDTPEYRQNVALAQINAQAAYLNGITGSGVIVAVIDSGVTEVPELKGQLLSTSTNVATGSKANLDDFNGHGTAMAGIIAALRDNATNNNSFNMHGVAFSAKILAINATTAADCVDYDNCSFFHSNIAAGYDYARTHGADVINESLGSDNLSSLALVLAMQKAVAADIVIVVPAGNIGVDTPAGASDSVQLSAATAYASWANGQIIIAGSVDSNNVISTFSYKAGVDAQNVYLMAPGEDIIAPNYDTAASDYVQLSGTSASTAIISGSVALLIEAFPNLTAAQTTDLLFTTATDLGDPGTDIIYGRGLINLQGAFTAQGKSVIAGSGFASGAVVGTEGTVSAQNIIISGGAFGADISFSNSFDNIMVLDRYQRSFNVDLSKSIVLSQGALSLENFSDGTSQSRHHSLSLNDKATVKMAWRSNDRYFENNNRYFKNHLGREKSVENLRMSLSYNLGDQNQGEISQIKVSSGMSIAEMLDQYRPDDYMAPNKQGFASLLSPRGTKAMAYITKLSANTAYEVAFAQSNIGFDPSLFSQNINVKNTFLLNRINHQITPNMKMAIDVGVLQEKGSVLGSISRGVMQIGKGAKSAFMGFKFDMILLNKMQFFAQASMGMTAVDNSVSSIIGNISRLKSHSYLMGIKSTDLIFNNDQLSLSFSQPLRLSSGNALISNVSSRDYQANIFNMNYNNVGLSPSGRERDIELSYAIGNIYGHSLRFNMLHQINPWHIKNTPNATSVLLRLGSAF